MVVRIRITGLEAIGATKERVHQVIGAGILDLDDDLKRGSPVDDGYFVNSWQVQANGNPPPRDGFNGPRPGGMSPEEAALVFRGVAEGAVVSLVNSADYAVPLAEGHSKQAAAGWVEACAGRLQDFVDVHVMQSRAADGD